MANPTFYAVKNTQTGEYLQFKGRVAWSTSTKAKVSFNNSSARGYRGPMFSIQEAWKVITVNFVEMA